MTGRDKPRHPRSPQSSQGKQERHTGKVQQQLVLASKARCMGGNSGDVLRQHLLSAANVQSRSDRLALVGGACGGACLLAQLCVSVSLIALYEKREILCLSRSQQGCIVSEDILFYFPVPFCCLWRSYWHSASYLQRTEVCRGRNKIIHNHIRNIYYDSHSALFSPNSITIHFSL